MLKVEEYRLRKGRVFLVALALAVLGSLAAMATWGGEAPSNQVMSNKAVLKSDALGKFTDYGDQNDKTPLEGEEGATNAEKAEDLSPDSNNGKNEHWTSSELRRIEEEGEEGDEHGEGLGALLKADTRGAAEMDMDVVIGTDERVRLGSANLLSGVRSGTGRLEFSTSEGRTHCTATLITSQWLLTAGHCVHEGNSGNWYGNFMWYPRKLGAGAPGFSATFASTTGGWYYNRNSAYDVALVKLDAPSAYWTGQIEWGPDAYVNTNWGVNFNGYPADLENGEWMYWAATGHSLTKVTSVFVEYNADSAGGMSGSAVYAYFSSPQRWKIYAVHIKGTEVGNKALRIRDSIYNYLTNTINNN